MHALHREVLPNGLRVVVAPLTHLHTVDLSLFVKCGSRYEDPRTNGLSHFLEHMLFRGTERHPSAYEINRAIEELGGQLTAATHVDFTVYRINLPPESLAQGLALFGEVFRSPIFEGIDVEKGILREEILEGLDEDGQRVDVDDLSRDLLFAPHPLGYNITGELANVEAFTIEDLRAHMHRYYKARNMVLTLAGDVDPREAADRARLHFGHLAPGEPVETSSPDLDHSRDRFALVSTTGSQTELRISFPTFGVGHPQFRALQLLSRILDDGCSTRLHRRIADERGLAYDVFAGLDPYEDLGVFDVGAAVEHSKAPELLREAFELLHRLRTELVGEDELEKARRRYLWDLRASLDDAGGIATFYGTNTLFGVSETLETAAEEVRSIRAETIREVAQTLFGPQQAHVAAVGLLEGKLEQKTRAALDAYA